jgi:hypothetical protein
MAVCEYIPYLRYKRSAPRLDDPCWLAHHYVNFITKLADFNMQQQSIDRKEPDSFIGCLTLFDHKPDRSPEDTCEEPIDIHEDMFGKDDAKMIP